jgi:hypothetical protein
MLLEKIAIEALALIVVLVLLLSVIVAARRVGADRRRRRQAHADELARFDELLHEHETLRAKTDRGTD